MNPIRLIHGRARNTWRASLLAGLTCAGARGARVQIFSAGHGSTILVASYGAA